ncbi:hypothetical protein AAE478_009303 [Parahypoxylon ruwenzoriense]
MAPTLIKEGKIQILGQTTNSAVASDSRTGQAKDSLSVLKGGTIWYNGLEALGPGNGIDESDERARKEADIYEILGQLELAIQFAEHVAHIHQRGVIWGDLSTRNALLVEKFRIKLGDFADSGLINDHPSDWYGCEVRYCPPGSDRPHCHDTSAVNREIFVLGTAIYEIVEWKVPYGPETEIPYNEVIAALVNYKWPQLTHGNPAEAIIRRCWEYMYESSLQVVDDMKSVL